jgi:hypothetical protein
MFVCNTLLLVFKVVIVTYEPVLFSIPPNLLLNELLSFLYSLPLNCCNNPTEVETLDVYVSILSNLLSNSEPVDSNLTNLLSTDVEYVVTFPIPVIVEELILPVTAKSLFN